MEEIGVCVDQWYFYPARLVSPHGESSSNHEFEAALASDTKKTTWEFEVSSPPGAAAHEINWTRHKGVLEAQLILLTPCRKSGLDDWPLGSNKA